MSNELFYEVPAPGNEYKFGDWKSYAVHDNTDILGFFGDYRFMGNFDNCPVCDVRDLDGFLFKSPEHSYQAAKSVDPNVFFVNNFTAKEVKKWGNSIILRPDWEEVKYEVMSQIVFDKYCRYKYLRELLLQTGDKFLEERNHWHDNIWGNCICQKCASIVGKNMLGKITMKVREFWK